MSVHLSELTVYDGEKPLLRMTFPVANKTFLDAVAEANKDLYNGAATAILGAGIFLLFALILICWCQNRRVDQQAEEHQREREQQQQQRAAQADPPPTYDALVLRKEPPEYKESLMQEINPEYNPNWAEDLETGHVHKEVKETLDDLISQLSGTSASGGHQQRPEDDDNRRRFSSSDLNEDCTFVLASPI